ncbi:hypothetical protein A2767_06710 [Candidatus Roizmanbacteria bacterium RIFCSPHIGHO2_01_FULL_35_10]|nr:MAG: hypothetical protein A2767_06710 [Candidatus Roizmanbacteria bacterium RIFCSPHIGHO2_01_FULL_35_10]
MKEKTGSICLIIPPSVFLLDERVFVSLGILKVAAVLEEADYRVEVLDLSGISNYEEALTDYISYSENSVFGITATTPQMPAVAEIVKVIRKLKPKARIILGGPHATLVNAARKGEEIRGIIGRAVKIFQNLEKMFDVIVAGDGEEAIFHALKPNVLKLIDADDIKSNFFLDNLRLNNSPFPARHLVDMESYHYSIDGERAISLIGQLGCPFGCGFCGGRKSPTFRKIRIRSAENIIQEIEFLHKTYGVSGFMFYDDELNVNPKIFVQLMDSIGDLQEKLGVKFRLRGFVKSNLFNDEQAKAMYRAGFRWLLIGFESGSERMLLSMNKRSTVAQNTACMEIARKNGLKVKALMSIGHPGESEESIMETHNWLLKVKPDDFDVAIITVYPGTGYYDDAMPHPNKPGIWIYRHNGEVLYSLEVDYLKVADYYKGDPEGGYRSYVYTDYLIAEEIVKFRDFLEKDIRQKLNIPFNPSLPAKRYEHSMGIRRSY